MKVNHPVFPIHPDVSEFVLSSGEMHGLGDVSYGGMDVRTYLASQAISWLASVATEDQGIIDCHTKIAVMYADSLLKALEESEGE